MMNKTILYVVLAALIIGGGWAYYSHENTLMMQKDAMMKQESMKAEAMKNEMMKKDAMKGNETMMATGTMKTDDSMMKK